MLVEIEKNGREAIDTEELYCVGAITPEGEGEILSVSLLRSDGERLHLHILVEQYTDLGLRQGELSPEQAEALLDAGRLCDAIHRGLSLLQYGDQSRRRLADKLVSRGMSREVATAAAEYLAEKGYIREDNSARIRAEQGVRKLWGLRRIREDLRAHGFASEAVEDAMDGLAEVDWVEKCATAIRKKYRVIPEDRGARQKLMAAVLRLGYDSETIKEALRSIMQNG